MGSASDPDILVPGKWKLIHELNLSSACSTIFMHATLCPLIMPEAPVATLPNYHARSIVLALPWCDPACSLPLGTKPVSGQTKPSKRCQG
jgi:hypothetical protein